MTKLDSTGLGWYSLWVAIMAVGYSIASYFFARARADRENFQVKA